MNVNSHNLINEFCNSKFIMDGKRESKLVLIFTAVYLIFFALFAFAKKNYEFLFYTIILSSLIFLIVLYYKKLHLAPVILGGISIVGFMHLAGGTVDVYGTKLYGFWLIEGIFKYDNLIHMVSIFVATFVAYSIVSPHLDLKVKHHPILFSLLLVLIALGIGAINEIFEFGAVVFLEAQEAVGDSGICLEKL